MYIESYSSGLRGLVANQLGRIKPMRGFESHTLYMGNNVQYVEYNEGQFRYINTLYGQNKPQKFILSLIEKAKEKGKLTKSQDYYLMYYLQKGETPYDSKLLPNNI